MTSQSYEFIATERRGRVFIMTIDRPEVMNALHPPANEEMTRAWDEFAADDELWVGILTGAGERAFSAGNDLKYTAKHGSAGMLSQKGFGGLSHRFDLNKPLIAAVGGVALGGGFELALACDIIVASERAVFGLPEPRVGLAALAGGIHRLPRQIGLKNAMALMMTGRHVDAEEAQRLGLVQEITKADKLMERALSWAEEIMACAPLSVRASKEAALGGLDRPVEEAMAMRFDSFDTLFASEDFVEGPRAFAEKRKPDWKGR